MKIRPLTLALIALGTTHYAFAADTDGKSDTSESHQLKKVEVLGSRIKRVDTETIAPVEVIRREQFTESGKATVAEVLRDISANSGQSYGESFVNSFAPGAAGISLRGLGEKSTLVLVNGRRVANYGFALGMSDTFTDLNAIPASAIERVEVLKDGASALYGSDAIAGVINIVLRQDFRGAEISTDIGQSTHGDLTEKHAGLTGGFGDPGEQGFNVLASLDLFKRDALKYSDRKYTRDSDTRNQPGGNFGWSSAGGTYRTTPRTAFPSCPSPAVKTDGALFGVTGSVCAYNPGNFLDMMPKTDRANFFSRGTYNLGGSTQVYAELFASHNETEQSWYPNVIAGTGVHYDPTTGGVAIVDSALPVGNPSNPYNTPTRISYGFFDIGSRKAKIVSDTYRFLTGIKGQIRGWDWDSAVSIAEDKINQNSYNYVNAVALQQAIANGSYNFLAPTAAQNDALRINFDRKAKSRLYAADSKLTGEFGKLPGGAVGVALGVEVRRETLVDTPSDALANGLILGQGATRNHGGRNAGAMYTELSLPVAKGLELSAAGREDKYSDFGSAFSPKLGAKYTPFKELAFRTSWGKGFRAPTLAENSQSTSTYFTNVTDPKDGKFYNIAGVLKGNPNLQPEKSRSINFGIIAQPVDAFDMTIDYYQIRQNQLVTSDNPQYLIDHEDQFPGAVVRDPLTGNPQYVTTVFRNVAFVKTRGVDLGFNWRIGKLGDGALSAHSEWTYLLSWKTPPAEGEQAKEYAGSNEYDTFPRNRGNVSLSWKNRTFTATLKGNLIGGFYQKQVEGQNRVDSWQTVDLFMAYKITSNLETTFSIQNIENKTPPFDANYRNFGGFNYNTYNANDRYFRLGLNYKL